MVFSVRAIEDAPNDVETVTGPASALKIVGHGLETALMNVPGEILDRFSGRSRAVKRRLQCL